MIHNYFARVILTVLVITNFVFYPVMAVVAAEDEEPTEEPTEEQPTEEGALPPPLQQDQEKIFAPAQQGIYGALYEAGHLTSLTDSEEESEGEETETKAEVVEPAPPPGDQPGQQPGEDNNQGGGQPEEQGNTEAVLIYEPNEKRFVAITTNRDAGAQWWVSDEFGLNWTQADSNPLEQYGCSQAGRHAVATFDGKVYFGASCEVGALIFELTGLESAELVHTLTDTGIDGLAPGYPTAGIVNDELFMWFNGGATVFDGSTWQDKTDFAGQPAADSLPLEVSDEQNNEMIVAFTSGEVARFDGTTYTIIGEDYLDGRTDNNNLPAVGWLGDDIWVGNQSMSGEGGATIFWYDEADADGDNKTWENLFELDAADTIVNKMEVSAPIDWQRYIVYFTSNGDTGTNVVAIDKNGTRIQLIDSGLGGTDPANNREVVSVASGLIGTGEDKFEIMLFATQNPTDETKIFALRLGDDLGVSPTATEVISAPVEEPVEETTDESTETQAVRTLHAKKTTASTVVGETFRVRVPKNQAQKGDIFTLYVNNKKVQQVKAKSNKVVLKYAAAKKLAEGKTFTVRIGRKVAYGKGSSRVVSSNTVNGSNLKVTVVE